MSDTTESGLPRVVAIAWGTHTAPQRGPARGLSHERIVEQAIEIADEHGLPALTMQRLAESLGFTTMSLYRYVANKDELLMLMQGSSALLPEEPPLHEDWRENVREWGRMLLGFYRQHPWLTEVTRGPTAVLMPGSVRAADLGLRAVQHMDLSDQEKIAVILSVSAYASSFAELERDLATQDVLEFGPEAMAELSEVITAERFPHLAPLMARGSYVGGPALDAQLDVAFEFEFGLELFIEGIAARQTARQAPSGDAARGA